MKAVYLYLLTALLSCLFFIGSPLPFSRTEAHITSTSPALVAAEFRKTEFDSVKTNLLDYIWPTDASTKVTSAFAEYRTTHFHGGIDIGTNGRTGYKVFSVRDGDVYRIRITPNGYGKMLYVRHDDGYYSTYAHLLTFSDTIDAVSRKEQYRKGTYAIDYYPKKGTLRVNKGEVIAYTGDSGFGPAHLHFELRDENLNPINPMLCPGFGVKDDIPPAIRRILISPLSYGSTVDNQSRPKILSRFPGRKGSYRIPQTLRVHGMIGMAIEAQDRVDGSASKEGIHGFDFYIDDSLSYSMQLDRVPAEETKQIDLHYDLPTIIHGWGKFQKLYIEPGNTLPFYNNHPAGTGMINTNLLTEGEHTYRIVCSDISGNTTELDGKIFANHQPDIALTHVDDDEITLSGKGLDIIERCLVYARKNADHEWTPRTFLRKEMEMDAGGIEIPFQRKQYDVVKVVAESRWGSSSPPFFYFYKKPEGTTREIHLATEVKDDFVAVTVTSTGVFTEVPRLEIQEGDSIRTVTLEAMDIYKYGGTFQPLISFMGNRVLRLNAEVNGKPASTSDVVELYPIAPDRANSGELFDKKVFLSYDSGAVYSTMNVQANVEFIHNTPVYMFEPDDALLNKGITISVSPGSDLSPDHLGLYFRSNGGWIFQTSTPDSGRKTYSAKLDRTLGEVALLRDAEPPSFGKLRLSSSRGKPYASFRYHDNLSGVDTDEIKMYIDGNLVIPEIDGEKHQVFYQAREALGRGKHSLKISMSDRMQNTSEIQRTFSVR